MAIMKKEYVVRIIPLKPEQIENWRQSVSWQTKCPVDGNINLREVPYVDGLEFDFPCTSCGTQLYVKVRGERLTIEAEFSNP